jgi:hypothetical protein
LRYKGLKTERDVDLLIEWMLEPVVGSKVNCNFEGHVAPRKFVYDVLLDRVQNFIVWANRGGSKSYLSGLVTWARSSFKPRMETTILGGSFEQSEKSYKAMSDFWRATKVEDRWLESEPMRSGTKWVNGSIVSVLTASTKSARGPHPQALIMDEIDEMEEDVYVAALSQPQSKYGIKASLGKLSTNHRIGGMMDIAVEKAKETGSPVYKWCIWECLKPCLDYKCSTCKLTKYCPGEQMKKADGYYEVEDLIAKFYDLSEATLQTEWFCNKRGRSDLVYGSQYDEKIHSGPGVPSFNPSKRAHVSVDWGGTLPFSVGVWQKFEKQWVRVDEVYMPNTTNKRLLKECKKKAWWKNVKEGVADPNRPDLISEWSDEHVSLYKAKTDVDVGIESVRDCLAPVLGDPKILINSKCKYWIMEAGSYAEKNGKPVKAFDHAMDDTRYFVMKYIKPRIHAGVRSLS